jgi:hypothetical protein
MRLFSFILAIYFLGLSVIGCGDSESHLDTCKTVACAHLDAGEDGHHADGDVCSPLCTCNCCGGTTLVEYFDYSFSISEVSKEGPEHITPKLCAVSQVIWQPPKIS